MLREYIDYSFLLFIKRRLTIGLSLRFELASQLSLGLRHILLCHSSCVASFVPSAYARAKRR
ncbi:hypothetical protein EHR05_19465 [Leptospira licerasiae]|nr:hypothetical protein EHR05_19465 [Leptospira licerasiae]